MFVMCRKVPCDSCVKRGCGAICPDGVLLCDGHYTQQLIHRLSLGSLTTGRGNRYVRATFSYMTRLQRHFHYLPPRSTALRDRLPQTAAITLTANSRRACFLVNALRNSTISCRAPSRLSFDGHVLVVGPIDLVLELGDHEY